MTDAAAPMATFEDRACWLVEKLLQDFPSWDIDCACADAGNAGRESQIAMVQQGGTSGTAGGYGPWQWTGPRHVQYLAYCARTGKDPASFAAAYAFHVVELRGLDVKLGVGDYRIVVTEVAAAKTLADKVAAFEKHYEMAGIVAEGDRLAYAQRAKAAWLANHPAAALPAPSVTPAAAATIAGAAAAGTAAIAAGAAGVPWWAIGGALFIGAALVVIGIVLAVLARMHGQAKATAATPAVPPGSAKPAAAAAAPATPANPHPQLPAA
jgi:hypothetical protein